MEGVGAGSSLILKSKITVVRRGKPARNFQFRTVDRLGLEQGVPVNQVPETYYSIFVHFNLDGHGPLDKRLSG
jgi:hypothetical protein